MSDVAHRISGVVFDEAGVPNRVWRGYGNATLVGSNKLVEGVAGKCIRLLAGTFVSSAETSVYFSSGIGNTPKSGTFTLVANQGFNLNNNDDGHLQSGKGESLNIVLGASANIGCVYRYILTEVVDQV